MIIREVGKLGKPFFTIDPFKFFHSKKEIFEEIEHTPVFFILSDLIAFQSLEKKFDYLLKLKPLIPSTLSMTFNYYYKYIKDSVKTLSDNFTRMLFSYYNILSDDYKYWFKYDVNKFIDEFIDYFVNKYKLEHILEQTDFYEEINTFIVSLYKKLGKFK